jgi:hypothetical protein
MAVKGSLVILTRFPSGYLSWGSFLFVASSHFDRQAKFRFLNTGEQRMKMFSPSPFKTKYIEGWEVRIPYNREIWSSGDVWQQDRNAKKVLVDMGIKLLDHTHMSGGNWEARSPRSYHRDLRPKELIATTYREIKQ